VNPDGKLRQVVTYTSDRTEPYLDLARSNLTELTNDGLSLDTFGPRTHDACQVRKQREQLWMRILPLIDTEEHLRHGLRARRLGTERLA
jgi:hypothetical protein